MSVKISSEFYKNQELLSYKKPDSNVTTVTLVVASCVTNITPGDDADVSRTFSEQLQDNESGQITSGRKRKLASVGDIMVALSIPTMETEDGFLTCPDLGHPFYVFGRTIDKIFEMTADEKPKVELSGVIELACNSISEPNKTLISHHGSLNGVGVKVYTSEELNARNWISQSFKDYTKDRTGFVFKTGHYNFDLWLCEMWYKRLQAIDFQRKFTFNITISDFELKVEIPKDKVSQSADKLNRSILQNEILSDFVIVSSDGEEIRCHKVFLAAQSDALSAMVSSEMQEGKSSRVIFEDMSTAGVKAFLDFIYTFKLAVAAGNPLIAFELLQAGHKYGIKSMENAAAGKLLKMLEASTAEIDFLVRLFVFVRNVESLKIVKEKVAACLMVKEAAELTKCELYQEIFKKQPDVAMDLCECFRAQGAKK